MVGLEQAAACGPEAEEEPEAEGEIGAELDVNML